MRVLHLLHRSVPGTHGYAVRSREIVAAQREKGLEPLVVTSPSQAPLGPLDDEKSEVIDGVRYFRTCGRALAPTKEVYDPSSIRSALRVAQNISLFTTALAVARKYRPAVIHAHSPFTCGIVGNLVGRVTDIPTVYEMRGIWEDQHVGRRGFSERSIRYRAVRSLENLALRHADACCVISRALAEEVRARGVSPAKIMVAPNGVDVRSFAPGEAPADLRSRLGLDAALTVGYIGSFFMYEGLDLLVEAIAGLVDDLPTVRLLLVGDGELMPTLKEMTARLEIADRVLFVGRVSHRETQDYYRLCDLLVLPRRDTRETGLVTPLKPLEIMAMSKSLVASDIGGHRELIGDGVTGVLFRAEDVADLQTQCRRLLADPQLRTELGRRARSWVEQNRDWRAIIDQYVVLYTRLIAARRNKGRQT
ncbi:MAG: glycosyltransferase [Desulfomonile sp.]|nr:glycosyltransferase [Desulfomonile sp.]